MYDKSDTPTRWTTIGLLLLIATAPLFSEGGGGVRKTAEAYRVFRNVQTGETIEQFDAPLVHSDSKSVDDIAAQVEVEISWGAAL